MEPNFVCWHSYYTIIPRFIQSTSNLLPNSLHPGYNNPMNTQEILDLLKQVKDPELKENIVEL